jgi:glyoxylase-like metal-dependent hydrolase (beta-lactamase superfamily II)
MVIAPAAVEIGAATWRIEARLGERNVFEYLLASEDELLLIDTGTAGMARDAILPAIESLGFAFGAVRFIVVTHPDLDHQGGLAVMRDAAPDAVTACGFLDRAMIRRPEQLLSDRYQQYMHEHGVGFDDVDVAWMRANYGGPVEIDLTLVGGERLSVGDRVLEVLPAAGHSAGHLMLFEPTSRMLFCSDVIHSSMCPSVDGAPAELHSGHWPVAVGAEVGEFLAASREFVARLDDVLLERLGGGRQLTLGELCSSVEGELGPWDSPTHMLMFIVHGHIRRLVRARAVELVAPGVRPARYRVRHG